MTRQFDEEATMRETSDPESSVTKHMVPGTMDHQEIQS